MTSMSTDIPAAVGFRTGSTSVHTSRTMMLAELSQLLGACKNGASPDTYRTAIVEENILGKRTVSTRERTSVRLAELYALDAACPAFRVLLALWASDDTESKPMLAFLLATARDPLLRESTPFILDVHVGDSLESAEVAEFLRGRYEGRFRESTLQSTAKNLASSWTQAGYLHGKVRKTRQHPQVTPVNVAYALCLGHLEGLRGKRLLGSRWLRFLDRKPAEVHQLALEASRQGWLNLKETGPVIEISFPNLLSQSEMRLV